MVEQGRAGRRTAWRISQPLSMRFAQQPPQSGVDRLRPRLWLRAVEDFFACGLEAHAPPCITVPLAQKTTDQGGLRPPKHSLEDGTAQTTVPQPRDRLERRANPNV